MKDYYLAYPQLQDYLFCGYRFIDTKNYPVNEDKVVFVHDVEEGYKSNKHQLLRKKTKSLIHLYIKEGTFCPVKEIRIPETRFDVVLQDTNSFINHFVDFYGYEPLDKELDLSRNHLTSFVKESLALGEFSKDFDKDKKKMYYVFESFNKNKKDFVESFLQASSSFEGEEIVAGLVKFFERSKDFNNQKFQQNDYYKKILSKASYNSDRVKRFLENYLKMCDNINHDLRFISSFL